MEEVGEECGVGAVYLKDCSRSLDIVPKSLVLEALAMQHRGQRSAGMSVYNPYGRSILAAHKDLGLVKDVFKINFADKFEEIVNYCVGLAGIVHTRYSTSGNREDFYAAKDEVQPFERRHGRLWKRFSLVFNGNLANHSQLREELKRRDYWLDTEVDTEVLMNMISLEIKRQSKSDERDGEVKPDLFSVTEAIMNKIDGAYNVLALFGDGNLLAFRDPKGIRPLVWGENEKYYAVASESAALEKIGVAQFKDVEPGEALVFSKEGVKRRRLIENEQRLCHFEMVYFAKAHSTIDGIDIRRAREALGRELSKIEPLKQKLNNEYLVVPAPWTAVPAAEAYAESLGLNLRISIEKDDNVRNFIKSSGERETARGNYIIHKGDVFGKKVILFDDSIVRGDTSKELVHLVRSAGAKEVHLRSTEPPIKWPCFYGIDFPTREELIANKSEGNLEEDMARLIGADSVVFQTISGLEGACGEMNGKMCMACLNGNYPTSAGQNLAEKLKC